MERTQLKKIQVQPLTIFKTNVLRFANEQSKVNANILSPNYSVHPLCHILTGPWH